MAREKLGVYLRFILAAATLLALCTGAPLALGAADRYAVVPLPFIPFSDTGGEALSNTGVVAGGIANSDGSVSLAQWSGGVVTRLGVAPGLPTREFTRLRVFGINTKGAIVGTIHTSVGETPARSFVYDQGTFTVLPLADPADLGGAAVGINDAGEVVGYDRTSAHEVKGWLWKHGAYSSLPVAGTNTAALGINSGGTIIGNRTRSIIQRLLAGELCCAGEQGYVLSRGSARYVSGFVYAINDFGAAAGGSPSRKDSRATVFGNGIAKVIVDLPSSAVGINSRADVVGSYQPPGYGSRHLFLWNAAGGAIDLTPASYRSAEAAAINDRGEVLGFGATAGGASQYFLLVPDAQGVLAPRPLITAPAASAGRTAQLQ